MTRHDYVRMMRGVAPVFERWCKEVGLPPTRRQYSKWRRDRGLAWQAFKRGRPAKK